MSAVPLETLTSPSTRRGYGTAWWGMSILILTEGMVFAILLASYFFLRAASRTWPLAGIELPELRLAIPFSAVLWGSSLPIFWAEAGLRRGDVTRLRIGLALSFVMGAAFLGYTLHDFQSLTFGWRDNAYGSIFYVIVGLHALHVVIGLAMNLVVQLKASLGRLSGGRHASVEVFALYWHFVDVVWVFVFASLIVGPHLR
jgi:heme/copper-type cytochrome/quinol oxidase subunit 3